MRKLNAAVRIYKPKQLQIFKKMKNLLLILLLISYICNTYAQNSDLAKIQCRY